MYRENGRLVKYLALGLITLLMASCSTNRNTTMSRFFHATTSRFNILYNGQVAYRDGQEAQEDGHQDDYSHLLPIFIQSNEKTAAIGKGNYETAITKSEKAIKLHSIKKRPTVKSSKKKTPKQKEYLQRKEYNPYLKHAWLMLGQSQYNKGEYIEASSTFNYILRLYATQPEVHSIARAWLARCYMALGWYYDAEDVLDKILRDSISPKAEKERRRTLADYYVQTQQYDKALQMMPDAIKYAGSKLQRSRLHFLSGQLLLETNQPKAAYKEFSRVIRSNPPYELEFNARIRQTEVMSKNNMKSTIKKLQRMARDDKNKDYLDQVYYAIGNIYLAAGDTAKCIGAYEKGVEKATQSGIAKAVLLLKLSQVYWERENYIDAQRTYKDCISILNKEHESFKQSEERSKALDETAPHLQTIKLQDSLQVLAKLPEKERLEAIDRVINELKKKEKEEAKKNAANGGAGGGATTPTAGNKTPPSTINRVNGAGNMLQRGAWYFYNPTTVQRGKQEFQRKWGNRPNEDNWRRSDKRAELEDGSEEYDYSESADSLSNEGGDADDEEQKLKDSLANDPHHREYYLKEIPMTEEMMEASNQQIHDGLLAGGVLVMEKIQNYPYAMRLLQRLMKDFPATEKLPETYYNMFLLNGRMENEAEAERYRQLLIDSFPEHKLAILLANPNYEQIARNGKHIEDSLYAATYDAYKANRYAEVDTNFVTHTQNFEEGKHRARILFVAAMSKLYSGDRDEFMKLLEELVSKFGSETLAELAGNIVKGVKEGRLLSDSKYDSSDLWKRRKYNASAEGDSIAADTLTTERFTTFNFVIAYPTNSLDEDQLLFEMARYNFTSYMVRNFEIEISDNEGLSMMCVRGFLSYDEVHAYAQRLYGDARMRERLEGIRTLLISDDNLKKLGTAFSFDDYKDFYDEQFAPMDVPEDLQFDEPTDMEYIDPENVDSNEVNETQAEEDEDDFFFGF